MTTTRDFWTYAEYARLPDDGNRSEVIDGEVLVTPAPGTFHQHVAANLFLEVRGYVERHGLGTVLWDVDLLFVEGQFLRPDFLYVPGSARSGITDRGVEVTELARITSGCPRQRIGRVPDTRTGRQFNTRANPYRLCRRSR
jgi:Uma2 family endonuclease